MSGISQEILDRVSEADDGTRSVCEISADLGLTDSTVYYARMKLGISGIGHSGGQKAAIERRARIKRCRRCDCPGWDKNPLIGDTCLWCRLELAGVNLLRAAEVYGWEQLIQFATQTQNAPSPGPR